VEFHAVGEHPAISGIQPVPTTVRGNRHVDYVGPQGQVSCRAAEYGVTESAGEVDDITDDRDIAARRIMLSSDEWVLGETPTFDVTWDIVDNAGTNRLKMRVERGSIVEATAYGSGAEAVAKALEGQPFDRPKIRKILASL
jgi:hypothetical protein